MQTTRRLLLAGLFILATAVPVLPEEQLANPFGGQPPEYTPDLPSTGTWESEDWSGTLLGKKRRIYLLTYEAKGRYGWSVLEISAESGKEYCLLETRTSVFTRTKFRTKPEIGGCWEMTKDGTVIRNLGGSRYGVFDCVRDINKGAGSCTYTATNGKKHTFAIRLTSFDKGVNLPG